MLNCNTTITANVFKYHARPGDYMHLVYLGISHQFLSWILCVVAIAAKYLINKHQHKYE